MHARVIAAYACLIVAYAPASTRRQMAQQHTYQSVCMWVP